MRLRSLQLRNFRGFEELDLTFDERLTVLVGVNGSGKTTILDALAVVLSRYAFRSEIRLFTPADRRNGEPDGSVALHFVHGGTDYRPTVVAQPWQQGGGGLGTLYKAAEQSPGPEPIPIACLFPVNRHAMDQTPGTTSPRVWTRDEGWENAFDAKADFSLFFVWFREREDFENEIRRDDHSYRDASLQAVRSAVESLVPGFSNLRVVRPRASTGSGMPELQKAALVVDKAGVGSLSFNQLSAGERTLAALVGDIARRLALANPNGDPLDGDAVVLIDEIELHLHPSWQVEVLDRLLSTFRNVQFVVTTHSPLVVSRVAAESVRLLENFHLVDVPETRGRDTSAIVEDVFGVAVRPKDVRDELDAIARLIDTEDLDGARARLHSLGEKLGEQDAEVSRLRAMIELLAS